MHEIDRDARSTTWLRAMPVAALAALACAGPAWASARSPARAARTTTIDDSGHLRLTSHHGFTLNEQGTATGTIAGTIYIHLTVASTDRVTAEVSIYPHGGSVTGYASASYHPAGATATFSGSMSVDRGSGGYNGAHGSGISFSGTVQRSNDAITVHVDGQMST
jgi:hypothetical protein